MASEKTPKKNSPKRARSKSPDQTAHNAMDSASNAGKNTTAAAEQTAGNLTEVSRKPKDSAVNAANDVIQNSSKADEQTSVSTSRAVKEAADSSMDSVKDAVRNTSKATEQTSVRASQSVKEAADLSIEAVMDASGDSSGKGSLIRNILRSRFGIPTITTAAVAILAAGTMIAYPYLSTPKLQGEWVFSGTLNTSVVEEETDKYDGWTVQVIQEGTKISGSSGDHRDVLSGEINGNSVSFSIDINDTPDGCGDFSEFTGTYQKGNGSPEITGSLTGHDCGNYSEWNGQFTIDIRN